MVVMVGMCMGVYVCDERGKEMGVEDDGRIVWEEFIGMWMRVMGVGRNEWEWVGGGFVILGIVDMWKGWGIGWFDGTVAGGMGMMMEDIVGGVIWGGMVYFMGDQWGVGIVW